MPVVVVEAGVQGWDALVAPGGTVVGLDRLGASGRGPEVMAALGFSPASIAEVARAVTVTAIFASSASG